MIDNNKNKKSRFERRRQQTHSRIKEAAIELILEKGYQEVTIQDITDRADYARATFYLHFQDIEELVLEYFNEGWQDHSSTAQELQLTAGGELPLLYYEILVDFLLADQNKDFYRIIFNRLGPMSIIEQIKKHLIVDIEKRISNNSELADDNIPPFLKANFYFGAMIQSIVWWLEEPNPYTPQQMADAVYKLMISNL
jgi:AcrR family transcriptional regulator